MVAPAGIEPATLGLEVLCSIQLSYGAVCLFYQEIICLGYPHLDQSPVKCYSSKTLEEEQNNKMSVLNVAHRMIGDKDPSIMILDCEGTITQGNGASILRNEIRRLISANKHLLVLNLAKVTEVDPTGIGELVSSYTAIGKEGGKLCLLNVGGKVLDLLCLTKLTTIFEIHDTEELAIASFKPAAASA